MGFESSHMARRRLAVLAMSHQAVHDALVGAGSEAPAAQPRQPSDARAASATITARQDAKPVAATLAPAAASDTAPDADAAAPAAPELPLFGAEAAAPVPPAEPTPLAAELEGLAHDILVTPGAGGALIAAYAEQARLLALVAEAAHRAPEAPLPPSVRRAVARAARASADTILPFTPTPA